MTQQANPSGKPSTGDELGKVTQEFEQHLDGVFTAHESYSKDNAKPENLTAFTAAVEKVKGTREALKKALDASKPVVPEKYKMELPKGSEKDPFLASRLPSLEKLAQEKKLTQAQLDERFVLENEISQETVRFHQAQAKAQHDEWLGKLTAHPQLGGDNLKKTNETITTFVLKNFDQDTLDWLVNSGAAYRPGFVEKLYAMAEKAEGKPPKLGAETKPGEKPVSPENRRYSTP